MQLTPELFEEMQRKILWQEERITKLESANNPTPKQYLILSKALNSAIEEKFGKLEHKAHSGLADGFRAMIRLKYGVQRIQHLTDEQSNEAITLIPKYIEFLQTVLYDGSEMDKQVEAS